MITLTDAEIRELTGDLVLPRCQVRRLRERGFLRARLERGRVVLERAHYEAVCRGEFTNGSQPGDTSAPRPRPKLHAVK